MSPTNVPRPASKSPKPEPKVAIGGAAGAVVTILTFIVATAGWTLPDGVWTAIGALVAIGAAYLTPNNGKAAQ